MNARGIPTAAYQVLHLLSCTSEGRGGGGPHLAGGVPHPCQGVPPPGVPGVPPILTWPGWGVPHPWWGYPPYLDLAGVPPPLVRPGWGTPPSGPGQGTTLGVDWLTKWKYNLLTRTKYAVGNKSIALLILWWKVYVYLGLQSQGGVPGLRASRWFSDSPLMLNLQV